MNDWIERDIAEYARIKEKKAREQEMKQQKALKKRMTQLKKQQDTKINYCKKQIASLKKKAANVDKRGRELVKKGDALKRELNLPITKPTRAKTIQRMLSQYSIRFNQMKSEYNSYMNAIRFQENRIAEIKSQPLM